MIKKTKPSLSVVPCIIDNVSKQMDSNINNTLLKDNEILYSGSLDDIITIHKSVSESTNIIELNSQVDILINKLIEDGILELGDYFGYDITQFNLSENVDMNNILSFQSTLNLDDNSKVSYSNNTNNSGTFWSLDNIKKFFGLEYVLLNRLGEELYKVEDISPDISTITRTLISDSTTETINKVDLEEDLNLMIKLKKLYVKIWVENPINSSKTVTKVRFSTQYIQNDGWNVHPAFNTNAGTYDTGTRIKEYLYISPCAIKLYPYPSNENMYYFASRGDYSVYDDTANMMQYNNMQQILYATQAMYASSSDIDSSRWGGLLSTHLMLLYQIGIMIFKTTRLSEMGLSYTNNLSSSYTRVESHPCSKVIKDDNVNTLFMNIYGLFNKQVFVDGIITLEDTITNKIKILIANGGPIKYPLIEMYQNSSALEAYISQYSNYKVFDSISYNPDSYDKVYYADRMNSNILNANSINRFMLPVGSFDTEILLGESNPENKYYGWNYKLANSVNTYAILGNPSNSTIPYNFELKSDSTGMAYMFLTYI